jgi:hypothetical protein
MDNELSKYINALDYEFNKIENKLADGLTDPIWDAWADLKHKLKDIPINVWSLNDMATQQAKKIEELQHHTERLSEAYAILQTKLAAIALILKSQ